MENELTIEEQVKYANCGLLGKCDGCGDDTPIHNHQDGQNYLTLTGKHFYCKNCLKKYINVLGEK